ncbi:ABC transporter permease [Gracilibacillus dipsosauri]|uniref:ABC transporter permease n=1 Tax=Gracilibacillus dipsosauri TaxID=178340 RepID=UPI00240A063F
MRNFFSLINNEQIKLYSRFSTWSMYIILAGIILASGLITFFFSDGLEEYGDNWREELQAKNEEYLEMQAEDEVFGDIHAYDIAKNEYYLENDIKPLSYDAWQFALENAGLTMLVSLFTIIVAASIVSSEFKWGTIKLLLIRPISRGKILWTKYVNVLIFSISMLIFSFLINLIIGAILFGINGLSPNIVIEGANGFEQVSVVSEILTKYGLNMVNLIIMATFAFMISTLFRNNSMAIGLAIFLMFAGDIIVSFLSKYDWAKFILFANTNLNQYMGNQSPVIDGMTLGFSITVLVVYYIIFLLVSWLSFTRRDVAGH